MQLSHKELEVISFIREKLEVEFSKVIIETPVDITVNAKYWLTLMCTPNNLDELAIGFLFNEGIINSYNEIKMTEICHNGSNIDIWLNHSIKMPDIWKRTSGCTGGATSANLTSSKPIKPFPGGISPSRVISLLELLLKNQDLYEISGGVHSSALSDGEKFLVIMEDIGRHNTLDKIAGYCLMYSGFPSPSILITTGRISSEMLQKSARIGASIIISRTAPSSLSIEYAKQLGICIIGYARKDRFKIYSLPEYVDFDDPHE